MIVQAKVMRHGLELSCRDAEDLAVILFPRNKYSFSQKMRFQFGDVELQPSIIEDVHKNKINQVFNFFRPNNNFDLPNNIGTLLTLVVLYKIHIVL